MLLFSLCPSGGSGSQESGKGSSGPGSSTTCSDSVSPSPTDSSSTSPTDSPVSEPESGYRPPAAAQLLASAPTVDQQPARDRTIKRLQRAHAQAAATSSPAGAAQPIASALNPAPVRKVVVTESPTAHQDESDDPPFCQNNPLTTWEASPGDGTPSAGSDGSADVSDNSPSSEESSNGSDSSSPSKSESSDSNDTIVVDVCHPVGTTVDVWYPGKGTGRRGDSRHLATIRKWNHVELSTKFDYGVEFQEFPRGIWGTNHNHCRLPEKRYYPVGTIVEVPFGVDRIWYLATIKVVNLNYRDPLTGKTYHYGVEFVQGIPKLGTVWYNHNYCRLRRLPGDG